MSTDKNFKKAVIQLNQVIAQCDATKNTALQALALLGGCDSSPNSPKGKQLGLAAVRKRRESIFKKHNSSIHANRQ